MKKNIIKYLIITIFIGIIILFIVYNNTTEKPLKSKDTNITIEIEDGEGLNQLIEKLDEQGLLKSKLLLKIRVKLDKINPKFISGKYEISTDSNINEIINMLEKEDLKKNQISVTIPEGFTIDDMADLFDDKGLFTKEEFIKAIKEFKLPDYVIHNDEKKYDMEGYLYPNTYFFDKDVKPEEVIEILNDEFNNVILEIEIPKDKFEEIIIKASLIEKEVKLEEEKSIVASVIENRLKKNMKLQFCSTVNYVIGYEGHEILGYDYLKIDSHYNTYKYEGLPIGPITTPTKSSIMAVLYPKTTDYLYFLTKDDNSHYFSKTMQEHENMKKK